MLFIPGVMDYWPGKVNIFFICILQFVGKTMALVLILNLFIDNIVLNTLML